MFSFNKASSMEGNSHSYGIYHLKTYILHDRFWSQIHIRTHSVAHLLENLPVISAVLNIHIKKKKVGVNKLMANL